MNNTILLEILWEALGMTKHNYIYSLPWWLDPTDRPRNSHIINPNTHQDIDILVKLGLMCRDDTTRYRVTPDGINLAKSQYAKRIHHELHGS